MSKVKETDTSSTCALCGIAEVDFIKLNNCDHCDLVRYCSDTCQKNHKSEHDEACKIRAAELCDELLFKQPESTYPGDCPICMLPLPIDITKSKICNCCSKMICRGCCVANQEANLVPSCPFCRKPVVEIEVERKELTLKRIKANDPLAMICQGVEEYNRGNYNAAFEWYAKAAELGDASAHCRLAVMYHVGQGVDNKDRRKEIYHLEEAALGGHPIARHNLGYYELDNNGNMERAVKHFLIAAAQGVDESIKLLLELFQRKQGFVSKEDLTTALRAHQAAVDATKSPQREAAEEWR